MSRSHELPSAAVSPKPQGLSLGSIQYWVNGKLKYTGWKASVSNEVAKRAMEWCKTGMLEGVGPVDHEESCKKYVKNNYQNPIGFIGILFPFIISGIISIVVQLILAWLLSDSKSRESIVESSDSSD